MDDPLAANSDRRANSRRILRSFSTMIQSADASMTPVGDQLLDEIQGRTGLLPQKTMSRVVTDDVIMTDIDKGPGGDYQQPDNPESDSEYDDEVGLPLNDDELDDADLGNGDMLVTVGGEKVSAVKWLKDLKPHTRRLRNAPMPEPCPNLRPGIIPKQHQLHALGQIEYMMKTPFKGIVIGHASGLGKTLTAAMAVMKAVGKDKIFSIVVVPPSLVTQWVREFQRYFQDDTIDVYVLNNPSTPFYELLKHDVVIVTYQFCQSQYRKYWQYVNKVEDLVRKQEWSEEDKPTRPRLSIFSDGLRDHGHKCPYLILDEAHLVKNVGSQTYGALISLREIAHGCIMLTGSMIDNTWKDMYPLATFLNAQPLNSMELATRLFSQLDDNSRQKRPEGKQLARLMGFLSAFVACLPDSTSTLPMLEEITEGFKLTAQETNASNTAFQEYQQQANVGMASRQTGAQEFANSIGRHRGRQVAAQQGTSVQWAALFVAIQHTYHPWLVHIMNLIRNYESAVKSRPGIAESLKTLAELKQLNDWRQSLREDKAWKSSRIMALIEVFNKQRDRCPGEKVLIFSDFAYFLEIVKIAFACMDHPVECLLYSEGLLPEDRVRMLDTFANDQTKSVLLISQGAGGLGLNLTCATTVILCGPFWNLTQEVQAYKRAYRSGQTKPVTVIRLYAADCLVETYRVSTHDRKHKVNNSIMAILSLGLDYIMD